MTTAVQWRPEGGDFASLRLDPDYRSGRIVLPGGRFAVYSREPQDCQQAAVATALDIDYAETPAGPSEELVRNRLRRSSPTGFWRSWVRWAEERGLIACFHEVTPPIYRPWWIGREVGDVAVFGVGHSVVMRHDTLVLDPSLLPPREPVLRGGITFDPIYIDGQPVRDWLREQQAASDRRYAEWLREHERTP